MSSTEVQESQQGTYGQVKNEQIGSFEQQDRLPEKQNSGKRGRGRRNRNTVKKDGKAMQEVKPVAPAIVSSDVTAALAGLVLQSSNNERQSQLDFIPAGAELQKRQQSRGDSVELPQAPHPSLASSLGDYLNSQELKVDPSSGASQLSPPQEANELFSEDEKNNGIYDALNKQQIVDKKNQLQQLDENGNIQEDKESVDSVNKTNQDVESEAQIEKVSQEGSVEKGEEKVKQSQDGNVEDEGEGDPFSNGYTAVPGFGEYVMNGNDSDLADSSGDEEQVVAGDIRDSQWEDNYLKEDAVIKNGISTDLSESDSELLARAAAEALKFRPTKETIKEEGGKPPSIPPLTVPSLQLGQGNINYDVQETPRRSNWFTNFFAHKRAGGSATTPPSPRAASPSDPPRGLTPQRSLDDLKILQPQRSLDDLKADIAKLSQQAEVFSSRRTPTPDTDDMAKMSHQREPSLLLWGSSDGVITDPSYTEGEGDIQIGLVEADEGEKQSTQNATVEDDQQLGEESKNSEDVSKFQESQTDANLENSQQTVEQSMKPAQADEINQDKDTPKIDDTLIEANVEENHQQKKVLEIEETQTDQQKVHTSKVEDTTSDANFAENEKNIDTSEIEDAKTDANPEENEKTIEISNKTFTEEIKTPEILPESKVLKADENSVQVSQTSFLNNNNIKEPEPVKKSTSLSKPKISNKSPYPLKASEPPIDETKVEVPNKVDVKAFASKLQTQMSAKDKESMLRTYVHSITKRNSYSLREGDSFGRQASMAKTSSIGKTSSVGSNGVGRTQSQGKASSVIRGQASFKSQASTASSKKFFSNNNKSNDETSETSSQLSSEGKKVSSDNKKISKLMQGWESGAPKRGSDDEQESTPRGANSKSNIRSIMENFKDQTKKPPQKEEKVGGIQGKLKMFQDAQPKPKQTKKSTIKLDSKFGQTLAQFQTPKK